MADTVDIICNVFGFYYAGVFLIDDEGEWAVLTAGRGEAGAAMIAEGHKLKVNGHSMIGTATGTSKALIALDVGDEPVHFKNPHLPDTRSEMALPLVVGEEVIGAVTVQSKEEAAFSDDDITALQAMADQVAVAIHNARLYSYVQDLLAQAERRARLLNAAAQVGRDVTSILELDELLNRAVDVICQAYGFYYAGVFLVDRAGEWAVLRAGYGDAGAAMIAEGHKLKVGGHSMIGTSIAQQEARIALDVGDEPVHFKNPHLPDTRSEMALPLVAGDTAIGAVTVQSIGEAAFSDDDITTLQTMADHLSVAINNARLVNELEAAHAELLQTKTFEAIANSTIEAIHWIGNKALPVLGGVDRLRDDLEQVSGVEPELLESMLEDLDLIAGSARLIVSVQEHLIGPARLEKPWPAMLDDVVRDAVVAQRIPPEMVSYDLAPDLPLALADTTQIRRAFQYILENALEAMEGKVKKRITITTKPSEDGQFVEVSIADNGPGIPEDNLDLIWTTFYTTKGADHAGLGLSACLQIVKQMDGQVSASSADKRGAKFTVKLPAAQVKAQDTDLPSGKSILIIDDDDPWSKFAAEALTQAGNSVTISENADADPVDFDLILMDDTLAQTEAANALKWLGTLDAAGKTLVVASSLQVERTLKLVQLGAKDVVTKPYTSAALARALAD
jgi:signal transduction histidine kinase